MIVLSAILRAERRMPCANLKSKMQILLELQCNKKFSDPRSRDMITGSTESCLYVPDSVVAKWQTSLDTVPAPYNTGSAGLRRADLQVLKIHHGLAAQLSWIKPFTRALGVVCQEN